MTLVSILFQNEHAVVVKKPPMMLTVPSRFEVNDSREVLGRRLEKQLLCALYPVHRLDFEVSGLVLFAKTKEFHSQACQAFEHRQVRKVYQAYSLVKGIHLKSQLGVASIGQWESRLLRGKRRSYISQQGKPAITKYKWVQDTDKASCWELEPVTGRPHQLRFEMAHRGYPIWGDSLYGSPEPYEHEGIALRCVCLDFRGTSLPELYGLVEEIQLPNLWDETS